MNFPLQAANTRFVGVVADDVKKAFVRKLEVLIGKAGRFACPLHQEPLGDFQLFLLRIAGEAQNLHAVLKRLRNRM